MYKYLLKTFIPNYENKKDKQVRERYGLVFSIFGIVCNIILVIFKLLISFLTNSISIRTDALNNLSDIGSNLATLFGFKLSNKHADKDHPYGHGRMEYISGMIVSFLIILMGFESLKTGISKLFNHEELSFSISAIIVLIGSIVIKLVMGVMNKNAGKDIQSDSLLAAGQDSFNDSITTLSSLIVLIVYQIFNINIDAIVGIVVSLMILKSGYEIFKNVMDTILGQAPDKELIEEVQKTILAHKEILGLHDFMYHDYGLSQRFLTLHAEVSSKENLSEIHDVIDNIEGEIFIKFNILTTMHIDPIDFDDPLTNVLKEKITAIVKNINEEYSIHDFRIVKGNTHTNIVFDCLLPVGDRVPHSSIIETIQKEVNKIEGGPYFCVIQVEHSFI